MTDRFELLNGQPCMNGKCGGYLGGVEIPVALRVDGVLGEELRHGGAGDGEMARADLREDVAEVGGDGEVAILEELVGRERGPVAVDAAALDRAAHGEEAGAVAVVSAAVAVLMHGAAELAHGDDDDIGHAIAEVLVQRGQRLREAAE